MYFFVLSQAPPVLLILIANWTPDINAPGNNPATKIGWNNIPKNNGENNTKTPGKIISLKEAFVDT